MYVNMIVHVCAYIKAEFMCYQRESMWLTSWKARQVIALRCCFAFVYIYISVPVNLRHLNSAIASCSSLVCRRQLQTPPWRNPQRICTHKHFNALGGITSLLASHIARLRATWFLPVGHFLANIILPAWPRSLPLLSWGDIQVPPPAGFALGQSK